MGPGPWWGELAQTSGAPPVRALPLSQESDVLTQALPLRSPLPPPPEPLFVLPSVLGRPFLRAVTGKRHALHHGPSTQELCHLCPAREGPGSVSNRAQVPSLTAVPRRGWWGQGGAAGVGRGYWGGGAAGCLGQRFPSMSWGSCPCRVQGHRCRCDGHGPSAQGVHCRGASGSVSPGPCLSPW